MSSDDEMNVVLQEEAPARTTSRHPPSNGRSQARKNVTRTSPRPSGTRRPGLVPEPHGSSSVLEEDPDIIAIDPPQNMKGNKGKSRQKVVETTTVNSKRSSAKGKAPVGGSKSSRKGAASTTASMDVVMPEEIESEDEVTYQPQPAVREEAGQSPKPKVPFRPSRDKVASLSNEVDRWKQKATDLESQKDALSKQLEELFLIRHTEAEQAVQHLTLQYETRIKGKSLVKELTSQLARVEPLARTAQTAALHFLTREAADEEKRTLEEEMEQLRSVVKKKDNLLTEKTGQINDLEKSVKDSRLELEAEIDRSKELLAKVSRNPPPSASRVPARRPLGADDPKHVEVIKFYEDLTNLLVPSLKFEPNQYYTSEDDTTFTCVYTYVSPEDIPKNTPEWREKSISFTLRIFYDLVDEASEFLTAGGPKQQRVKYTPLELDKESEEFVKKLEFLNDAFTFPRSQLALFLKTVRDQLDRAFNGSDEEEGTP
ncbi:hypothetical protein SERLADRAFT_441471 [Serpula lacrymans var. lacrymans S7.9]|uniref:Monopolin complex subunit Csm1/Pcs1 C-terminal domain-containing protein n=1 Tax=Serpula lacrymans var. lacrymans (strain S7.9) TaxID=578457 RepID=F8P6L6_SERL9|nr:uncharacterized protein SERLADRAFT_441471 [Serpula lacrymans var. lacrymans S7.9]EGO21082.1 hypothetical protein SERLADRAFT_441471 [Serpula lacrymans var. lacrymans S7.9]